MSVLDPAAYVLAPTPGGPAVPLVSVATTTAADIPSSDEATCPTLYDIVQDNGEPLPVW